MIDPLRTSAFLVPEDSPELRWRQVVLSGLSSNHRLVVLGSQYKGNDVVISLSLEGSTVTAKETVHLSQRNGRLIPGDDNTVWQGPDGSLHRSKLQFNGTPLHRLIDSPLS